MTRVLLIVGVGTLLVSCGLVSCGSAGDGNAEPSHSATHAESGSSSGAGEHDEVSPPAVVSDPPPILPSVSPPLVRAVATVDPYGRASLAIRNEGADASRFSSVISLERASGEVFGTVEDLGTFTIGAELATEGCVELLPGAELRATWSCLRADAPDLVRDCARAPMGQYRFVVRSCDGSARTEGEPFHYGG